MNNNNKILWIILITILFGLLIFGLRSAERSDISNLPDTSDFESDSDDVSPEEVENNDEETDNSSDGIEVSENSNNPERPTASSPSESPDTNIGVERGGESMLTQSSWQWAETRNNGSSISVPTDPKRFILNFSNDRSFTSSTDCNQIGGEYSVDGNKLQFGNIYSTKMACAGDTLESEYIKDLNQVANWGINVYGQLVLFLGNTTTMVFNQS